MTLQCSAQIVKQVLNPSFTLVFRLGRNCQQQQESVKFDNILVPLTRSLADCNPAFPGIWFVKHTAGDSDEWSMLFFFPLPTRNTSQSCWQPQNHETYLDGRGPLAVQAPAQSWAREVRLLRACQLSTEHLQRRQFHSLSRQPLLIFDHPRKKVLQMP